MKAKLKYKIFFILLISLVASVAIARPGGGHSYSGGGGYGGSGGYGGDGGLLLLLFHLLPPEISIPLIIIFFIYITFKRTDTRESKLSISSHESDYYGNLSQYSSISRQIAQLRAIDPNFSRVLFLDFVSSLYNKFYSYQNAPKQLLSLTPFFDKNFLEKIISEKNAFVINEIVIGGMYIEKISIRDKVNIYVRIKSNMTIQAAGKTNRYKLDERWLLVRERNAVSPEPEKMHTLTCPSCGAPADFTDAGFCKHCGTLIVQGKMQWFVAERKVFDISVIRTQALLTYAPERGTELPTIYDPFLDKKIQVFEQENNVSWQAYQAEFISSVVKPYFDEIYKAWTELKWNRVRHLISDRLWESYYFWIKAYKQNNWRNVLDVSITKTEIVKLELDRFYEAITVRIYANGYDYVTDVRGRVLAGNRKTNRRFSEYWTFIRRHGAKKDNFDIHKCPACGAPAENIGQSGVCEYCGNKITWGDFSWILAIITQDEEYKG